LGWKLHLHTTISLIVEW